MKPPARGTEPQPLLVTDYSIHTYGRDGGFRIGDAQVDQVDGTPIMPPGLSAYGRTPHQDEWKYTFRVREGARQVSGACVERVGGVRGYGFGEILLDVSCTCSEGEQSAQLKLGVKGGEARLSDGARFSVWATRESKQGRRGRTILGYVFRKGVSDAGVDVTRDGARGYLPQGLPAEQRLPLSCLYAGLLLHRPTK